MKTSLSRQDVEKESEVGKEEIPNKPNHPEAVGFILAVELNQRMVLPFAEFEDET
jgi:hypothetical protein